MRENKTVGVFYYDGVHVKKGVVVFGNASEDGMPYCHLETFTGRVVDYNAFPGSWNTLWAETLQGLWDRHADYTKIRQKEVTEWMDRLKTRQSELRENSNQFQDAWGEFYRSTHRKEQPNETP